MAGHRRLQAARGGLILAAARHRPGVASARRFPRRAALSTAITGVVAATVSATLWAVPAPSAAAAGHLTAARVPVGNAAYVPPGASRVGPVSTATVVHLDVALAPAHLAALEAFVAAVSTPGTSSYHRYLRAGAFAERFGATRSTIAAVEATLKSQGLRTLSVSANRLSIAVAGDVGAAETAFATHLERFRLHGGRVAYANTSAPSLPAAVGGDVQAVVGLDNTAVEHPLGLQSLSSKTTSTPANTVLPPRAAAADSPALSAPSPCSSATSVGEGSYTANQLASAYGFSTLYSASDFGAGTTIALYELEPFSASDISTFQTCYGTSSTIRSGGAFSIDGGAGTGPGGGEAALDVEDALSLAPGAGIDVYEGPNDGTGAYDTYNAIVSQDVAQVVSTSWGECEPGIGYAAADEAKAENTLFMQAASQGQTVIAAAGDSGSEACYNPPDDTDAALAVGDPASQPYVTGVGGTSLALNSSNKRSSEVVWNDGTSGGAGGGGVSSYWQMPSYQSGASSSLNVIQSKSAGCSLGAATYTTCRQVPDVSADANEYSGYVIYYCGGCSTGSNGTSGTGAAGWQAIGGTSAAAPLWAALVAEADASSDCSSDVGFLNPTLYTVAGSSSATYGNDFYDVTSGNNDLLDHPGYYSAGTGYDMATGLGTPIMGGLVPSICSSPTVTAVSPSSGPSTGGTTVTITGTGFTASPTVDFGSSAATAVSCTSTSCTVTAPAGMGQVAVTIIESGITSGTSSASTYSYVPSVTALSASSGSSSGGTAVTITGTGFSTTAAATAIAFGTNSGSSVSCSSSTSCRATSPAGADSVNVTATMAGETSPDASGNLFTYTPAVTSLSPASGPAAGGTTITIHGSSLDGSGVTVTVNGSAVTASCSATTCTYQAPSGSGAETVAVTTAGGSSSASYTYEAAPTIGSINPTSGPTDGGTTVTISGTTLTSAAITVGSDAVGSSCTATTCTFTTPRGFGHETVAVVTAGGEATTSFAYVAPPASDSGYDLVGQDGGVFVFPTDQSAGYYGSLPGLGVSVGDIDGMVPSPDDRGYFLVGRDGGVFTFGDAPFLGSLPGLGVSVEDIRGIVPTSDNEGYFLVGQDGGVFAFGNAPYLGSLPGMGVHVDDVIGIAATPSDGGYWVVASSGTVYAFGNATAYGGVSGTASAVAGITSTPDGGGYWIVTQNGGVYPFGDAVSFGSLPALGVTPAHSVIGLVPTADDGGYWLIGSDGGVFAFGDAPFVGSLPGLDVNIGDVVGAVATTLSG